MMSCGARERGVVSGLIEENRRGRGGRGGLVVAGRRAGCYELA
jgi:hypothetical protein